MSVTVYLRTALFTLGEPDGHLPTGVMIIRGSIDKRESGTLTIQCAEFLDDRGRALGTSEATLELPMSKLDHIQHHA